MGCAVAARTVSGDYYDFIPLREGNLMLALGDISGKGISAALLMATVHAFVRAYSLEPERTMASVALSAGAPVSSFARMIAAGNGDVDGGLSPGLLMATLNYQLFRSTPPEKYATMFLACYDAASSALTYSNAGHLPPLLLGGRRQCPAAGNLRYRGGLFDGMTYDESTVGMEPGDIFVAYSDGITEPENEFGEFGEERLIELIQAASRSTAGADQRGCYGRSNRLDRRRRAARRRDPGAGARPLTMFQIDKSCVAADPGG